MKYILLKKIPKVSSEFSQEIEAFGFPYFISLTDELGKVGAWDRLNTIQQLGELPVKKKLQKTRMDYVMLQLYLHQLCRKDKTLQKEMKFSYSAPLKAEDLGLKHDITYDGKRPTIADAVQALAVVSNIGHFSRTFVASRAMLLLLKANPANIGHFISMFQDQNIRDAANDIIDSDNYRWFHLLNSALILQACDQGNPAIMLANQLLKGYLSDNHSEKIQFIMELYRAIRDISITCYDLQIADVPFSMTIQNEQALQLFLRERLTTYGDSSSAETLLKSINKFLNSTLYNLDGQSIKEYQHAKQLARNMQTLPSSAEEYLQRLLSERIFDNRKRRHYPDSGETLKLTLDRETAIHLVEELDKLWYVEVGWYLRSEERTVVARITKDCPDPAYTALKIMRVVTSELSGTEQKSGNLPYLLTVKFFLLQLFRKQVLRIEPTITDDNNCVMVARGSAKRRKLIDEAIHHAQTDDDDQIHEAKFLLEYLSLDTKNDLAYLIPASIKVYENDLKVLCEFDGIIVFPYRDVGQVVFLEAKNRRVLGKAQKCMKDKFEKLSLEYNPDDMRKIQSDCYYQYSVRHKKI